MRALVFIAVILVGCNGSEEVVVSAEDAAVVPDPPPPQPPPPPEPTHVTQTRAWAVFVDDELDQCIEHTRRFEIPASTEWSPRAIEDLVPLPEGTVIELADGCAGSFEGRTVIASCESTVNEADSIEPIPSGVVLLETFVTQNYRFATALATDARLEACLASHRHWAAVADDSIEYARARGRERDRSVTRR